MGFRLSILFFLLFPFSIPVLDTFLYSSKRLWQHIVTIVSMAHCRWNPFSAPERFEWMGGEEANVHIQNLETLTITTNTKTVMAVRSDCQLWIPHSNHLIIIFLQFEQEIYLPVLIHFLRFSFILYLCSILFYF